MKRIFTSCMFLFFLVNFAVGQIDSVYVPTRYIHSASKFDIEQAFSMISSIDSATFYAEDVDWGLREKEGLDADFINEKLNPVDALDYLKKVIATHQVIIINEAHNSPQHRLLINELLKLMPKNSIYAYEGLIDTSTQLSGNKVPLVVQKNYYTDQPQMAELFRTARKQGLEIYQYEDINAACYDTLHRYPGMVRLINKCDPNAQICDVEPDHYKLIREHYRDYVQGFNLANKIHANPGKKVLIHCGYGHAMKRAGNMEEFIRMCTGYTPYVIEQTTFNSHEHPELNLALYNTNINRSIKRPVILVGDKDTAVQLRKTGKPLADVYVFYPGYEKREGRFTNIICDECQLVHLNADSFTAKQFPILIKAYYQDEYKKYGIKAVPADVFEVAAKTDPCTAILRRGDYVYQIDPVAGKAVSRNIIVP